jgi:YVTN family beta-propeller protein
MERNKRVGRPASFFAALLCCFGGQAWGQSAYIPNDRDGTLAVIDPKSDKFLSAIKIGDTPLDVAVTKDWRTAYVSDGGGGEISIVDLKRRTLVGKIPVQGMYFVAVTPDGAKAYATDVSTGTISVIDTTRRMPVTKISIGKGVEGIAIASAAGGKAYVTNTMQDTVSVIDTTRDTVTATIKVGRVPQLIAITPDGMKVYVTPQCGHGADFNTVTAIDARTDAVVATITTGACTNGVAVTPDGTKAYVANHGAEHDRHDPQDRSISVIDTRRDTVIATIATPDRPERIFMSPNGRKAYAIVRSDDDTYAILAIDTTIEKVVASIPFGRANR